MDGDLLILTNRGRGIRFGLDQVSVQGRSARGVRGIRLDGKDSVVDAVIVPSESDPTEKLMVAVFTRAGTMKRTPLEQHPTQKRGGKGLNFIVSRARNPHDCLSIHACHPKDSFEVIETNGEEMPLAASKIPVTTREGKGFNPLPLKRGVRLALVVHEPWTPSDDVDEGADDEFDASPGAEDTDTVQDIPAAPDPDAAEAAPEVALEASTAFRDLKESLDEGSTNGQGTLPGLSDPDDGAAS
jgi:DNA gyrase subunit A